MKRNRTEVDRRQFVIAGSTAVAAVAAWPYEALAGKPPQAAPAFVSVGYCVETPVRVKGKQSEPFVPADSVLSGDPTFFRAGARMRVHAFSVAKKQSLSLQVLYPIRDLPERVPFYAWGSGGNNVAFRVPVGAQEPLEVVVERRDLQTAGAPVERAVLLFAVNSGHNAYKLNSGTYAVVLGRPGDAKPDWSSIRLRENREGLISAGGRVAFEYLLLTVTNPAA